MSLWRFFFFQCRFCFLYIMTSQMSPQGQDWQILLSLASVSAYETLNISPKIITSFPLTNTCPHCNVPGTEQNVYLCMWRYTAPIYFKWLFQNTSSSSAVQNKIAQVCIMLSCIWQKAVCPVYLFVRKDNTSLDYFS